MLDKSMNFEFFCALKSYLPILLILFPSPSPPLPSPSPPPPISSPLLPPPRTHAHITRDLKRTDRDLENMFREGHNKTTSSGLYPPTINVVCVVCAASICVGMYKYLG